MNPIKAARIRAGYRFASEACRALEIDQGHYSRLESGKKLVTRARLIQLSKVFGVTAGQLLGLEPLETPAQAAS